MDDTKNNFQEYAENIKKYFYTAMWHFLDHGCGAAFFKFPEELFNIVKNENPKNILEIGTGIGYTSYIMHCAAEASHIDTIEMEHDHCLLARDYLKEYNTIEVHHGEAESVLPTLTSNLYDVVFYDGYAPRVMFLEQYERLLKKGGLLLSANTFKKGVLERDGSRPSQYRSLLEDTAKWQHIKAFGDVVVYRKLF